MVPEFLNADLGIVICGILLGCAFAFRDLGKAAAHLERGPQGNRARSLVA